MKMTNYKEELLKLSDDAVKSGMPESVLYIINALMDHIDAINILAERTEAHKKEELVQSINTLQSGLEKRATMQDLGQLANILLEKIEANVTQQEFAQVVNLLEGRLQEEKIDDLVLAVNILGSRPHVKYRNESYTTTGGGVTETISVGNVAAANFVQAKIITDGTTPVTLVSATCVEGGIELEFSADPSDDHVLSIEV